MTEADFLRAIIDRPDDDAPRLIYADWLDEQGQCDLSEFIRVQCQLATSGWSICACQPPFHNDPGYECEACVLRRRERELLELAPSWPMLTGIFFIDAEWTFSRGFISGVTCTAEDWLQHGDAITAAQPIEKVTFSTIPDDNQCIAMDAAVRAYRDGRPSRWTMRRWPRVKVWE